MNIRDFFNSTKRDDGRQVRYAVLGAGWIAQEDFMPGVEHTGNSSLAAIITGDKEKARALADRYKIPHIYDYSQYEEALRSGNFDAIYHALPNSRHREFAVPALDAGIHVLLEKPMAPTEEDCKAIIAAAARGGARLMIAYRLHFDEATLNTVDIIRSGRIGEPRFFSSVFGQQVTASNSRAAAENWAGPLPDMGAYPINAARMFFGEEPLEAFAYSASLNEERFAEIEEMITVNLRFPGERLAQFVISYGVNSVNECRVAGTKGDVRLSPAFAYDKAIEQWVTIGDETNHTKFPHRDQFGGETKYFSDCILDDRHPEPDGEEGLADILVMKAIEESLRIGEPVPIRPSKKSEVKGNKPEKLRAVKPGELVHAAPPQG